MSDARHYIRALTGNALAPQTWQLFDDLPRKDFRRARILHGTLPDVWQELHDANATGSGVFCCVNETDLRGRKAANVLAVRALFVDLDGVTPAAWHLEPSIVVLSAAGMHAYWLVSDCPLAGFREAQQRLAQHYCSDPRVCDLPRVLRVPGFWHRKGVPFLVELVHASSTRYATAMVLDAIAHLPVVARPTPMALTSTSGAKGPVVWTAIDAVAVFAGAGMLGRQLANGNYCVVCPWTSEHTRPDLTGNCSSTVLLPRGANGAPVFHCSHSHCTRRYLGAALTAMGVDLPRAPRRHDLRRDARASLAEAEALLRQASATTGKGET